MYKFSENSLKKRAELHPDLQTIVDLAITKIDFSIICGYRGEAEQNKAYNEGKSKLKFPHGKHNRLPSVAMDLKPYPVAKLENFTILAKIILDIAKELGIKVRWGGDWDMDGDTSDNKFNDLYHFELV